MLQLTLFSNARAELPDSSFTVLTLFGTTELGRPTLARRVLAMRRREQAPPRRWWQRLSGEGGLILTLFGGCDLLAPTLVEEYTALRHLVRSGAVAPGEVERTVEMLVNGGESLEENWTVLTLFGTAGRPHRSAKRERKAMEDAEQRGELPAAHRRQLEDVVDQPEATTAFALGRLVTQPGFA